MERDFVLLTVKEEMWAQMLIQVLEDHNIPCAALPVYGAGLTLKSGSMEHLQIFVPSANLPLAQELLETLFSAEMIYDEEE